MSSIRREVSKHTLYAEIRLQRAVFRGSFLLVEGDTDGRVLKQFVDNSNCMLIMCLNKSNLLGVIEIVDQEGLRGVVGVVDDDYDGMLDCRILSDNLCYTESNDLECLVINSAAFDKVVAHYGSEEKVRNLEHTTGKVVRAIICEQAAKVGAMRLAARRKGWTIKFAGMTYGFVSNTSYEVREDMIAAHLISRSGIIGASPSDLLVAAQLERKSACKDAVLCNGDDLVRVAARAFKKAIGSYNSFEVNQQELVRVLYIAFDRDCFVGTCIFECLRAWQQRNAPYRVLGQLN